MSLNRLRAHELSLTMTKGEITWEHILWNTPRGIEESEEKGNSFVLAFREWALQRIQRIDPKGSRGEGRSALAGIPVVLEDNIGVKVQKAAYGSGILDNFISPYGDLVIRHLKEGGLISLNKTSMDEWPWVPPRRSHTLVRPTILE